MLTPEKNQQEIMRRPSAYQPSRSLAHWRIGRPLQTADVPHHTIGKAVRLAVFASDPLSSMAYATQEILGVLVAAGTIAFGYIFPVSIAIVTLLAIVTISYPTYFFIFMLPAMVGTGMVKYLLGPLDTVVDPPRLNLLPVVGTITPFIILHAFANGTTALTGVEAISNGITAFKEPRSRTKRSPLWYLLSFHQSVCTRLCICRLPTCCATNC